MTIEDLVARVREDFLDDTKAPYFWSDANIITALSNAERELCKRLFLLSDLTTVAICTIPVLSGTRSYSLDSRVLRIERLKLSGVAQPLLRTTVEILDRDCPGWEDTTGVPEFYILEAGANSIIFDKTPAAGYTASLTVKRLPLFTLQEKETSASPELQQLDDELIHGALKYLYLKPDAETFNIDMSKKWDNQFETDVKAIVQNKAALSPQSIYCRPERF